MIPEPDYDKVEVKSTFPNEDKKDDFRMPKWWDWRVQNWGTKWNSYDDRVEIVTLMMGWNILLAQLWSPRRTYC